MHRWLNSTAAAFLYPIIAWLDKGAQPSYRGTLEFVGLTDKVTVLWDDYAVPHVIARNEDDLFFTQGYLHAQERLWQMDLTRRFLCGQVAATFGAFPVPWKELTGLFKGQSCVEFDYFMRLVGIRQAAEITAAQLHPEDHQRLDAYAAGVNAYIDRGKAKLPWEFRLLRIAPAPWQPTDSLTIGKGLAFLLSTALFTRLNTISLCEALKHAPEKLQTLFLANVNQPLVQNGSFAPERMGGALTAAADLAGGGQGSNSWVIGPSRSRTGAAILCNDPHLRLNLPATWYLMHLRHEGEGELSEQYEAWGATVPGMPYVHIGFNRSIAWGITAGLCDDVELYRERFHPTDHDLYQFDHEWRSLTRREERIQIRGGKTEKRLVRSTHHGPLISDFVKPNGSREGFSFKWTGHEQSHENDALYRLNRAANWNDFLGALELHRSPSLNFTYCDQAGNIGYSLAGAIPVRTKPATLLPLEGWHNGNEWRGYVPFADLPRCYNPDDGFIISANQKMTPPDYPHYLSHLFEPFHRYDRIRTQLSKRAQSSVAELTALQLDTVSHHAQMLLELLRGELEAAAQADDNVRPLVSLLMAWDGDCTVDSQATTVFHVFHQRLLTNLLQPILSEDQFLRYLEIFNQCLAPTDAILANPESPWFTSESRAVLVMKALRQTQEYLSQRFGNDIRTWRWGRLHKLSVNHAFGRVPLLRKLLGIGPVARSGNGTTVNIGFYRHSAPYHQTVGASLRMVVDMKNLERSGFVICGGQSGHPTSKYYRDQVHLWSAGRQISIFRPPKKTAIHHLELSPRYHRIA